MTAPVAVASLGIYLGEDLVGEIVVREDDRTEFSFNSRYLSMHPRPVLGQQFEDDLRSTWRSRMQLPPFFSNLLPEERLRELVAAQLGVSTAREAHLLAYLGEDLPGAVRALPSGSLPPVSPEESLPHAADLSHPIKFSLAGMQPKLSMLREGRSLTFPASGRGGNWLVKMPSPRFAGVPENEFLTMTWARESGITVPEFELVSVAILENLPEEMREAAGMAFAIRRFDRPSEGRLHIEDFAQVLGVFPSYQGKYKSANYETLAAIIRRLHEPSYAEFLRRLVFVALSANGDAHLKNWSLWYPDRVHPQLAPAYDLVSTIEFLPNDHLGLNLARSKEWSHVRLASFDSLARKIGADPQETIQIVKDAVICTLDAWQRVREGATKSLAEKLEQHWKRLPLAADATGHPAA